MQIGYRSFQGEETQRELSPHGLVVHSGRWYLAAHDHGRDDLRTFRVDRMERAVLATEAAVDPPERLHGGRAREPLARARAVAPREVDVLLAPAARSTASRRLPATLAELVERDDGTLLRMRVSSLDWTASVLAGLDCAFTIHGPTSCGRASRRSRPASAQLLVGGKLRRQAEGGEQLRADEGRDLLDQ